MNSRERVLTAISRRQPDHVPIYLWLTPYLIERLRDERGVKDHEEYLKMDIRFAPFEAKPENNDFSCYTKDFHAGTKVDEWGCGTYPVGFYHFTKAECPLKSISTVAEIEKYPFPKKNANIEEIQKNVNELQSRGLAAFSAYECGTFEQAHALMGMEQFLTTIYSEPAIVECLLERISEVKARIAEAYVRSGVDVLFIGDDIGIQNGPLMAPDTWRKYILPCLKKIICRARAVRSDIPIAYHSCGSISFAVGGLIDAGITILQSIQPEANNCAELKRQYGNHLCFWGGVGSQSTMSHGTSTDVINEVHSLLNTVGAGGGYICSPAHFLEPETPLQNIDAFVEAIEKYGI